MKKTIQEIISKVDYLNEDAVIYAKKINGQFHEYSEGLLLELTEEEEESHAANKISEIERLGYEYFLEVYLVKELMEELVNELPQLDFKKKVEQIVHYAENDCFKFE